MDALRGRGARPTLEKNLYGGLFSMLGACFRHYYGSLFLTVGSLFSSCIYNIISYKLSAAHMDHN